MKSLGFKSKLLLTVTLSLVISCVITSLLSHSLIKEKVQKSVLADINYTMQSKSDEIVNIIHHTLNGVNKLAALYNNNKIVNPSEEVIAFTTKVTGISKLTLGYDDGSSFASRASKSFPNGIGIKSKYDPRTRPWYIKAKQKSGESISAPFFTRSDSTLMIGAMHTVKNGVLMADIRFGNLQSDLDKLPVGTTAIIADPTGLVLASNTPFAESKSNLHESVLSDFSEKLLKGKDTYHEIKIENTDNLIISKKIPIIDGEYWVLIFSVNKPLVFAPIKEATLQITSTIIGTAIITLLIILIALTFLYKPITSLRILVSGLSEGEGDLTQRLVVKGNDDLGKIALGINTFIAKLQNMLIKINDSTDLLTNGVHNLHLHSKNSSEILVQHSEQTTSIVSSIENISETATTVEEHSKSAESSTKLAATNSVNANQVLKNARDNIQALENEIKETSDTVKNMNDETTSIQSIVDVIGSIAEQTNLLALNASIEAARAGEQGRGFAVVADEVRALASRTQASTSEIAAALLKLQKEADTVVSAIKDTEVSCNNTVSETQNVSAILEELNENIQNVNEINTQNSHSASEQNTVINTINSTIHEIQKIVEKLTGEGQNLYKETTEISEINNNLSKLISQFKL